MTAPSIPEDSHHRRVDSTPDKWLNDLRQDGVSCTVAARSTGRIQGRYSRCPFHGPYSNNEIVTRLARAATGRIAVAGVYIADPQHDRGNQDNKHEQLEQPDVGLPHSIIFETIWNRFHVLIPTDFDDRPMSRINDFLHTLKLGDDPLSGRNG